MPTWRAQMQARESGGRIFVMGGSLQGPVTAVNEVYDPAADAWSTAAPLPVGRSHFGAVAGQGRIYVMGGEVSGVTNSCLQFDVMANSWIPIHPMVQARSQFAAGILNGKVIVSHGFGGAGGLSTTEEYVIPKTVYLVEKTGE